MCLVADLLYARQEESSPLDSFTQSAPSAAGVTHSPGINLNSDSPEIRHQPWEGAARSLGEGQETVTRWNFSPAWWPLQRARAGPYPLSLRLPCILTAGESQGEGEEEED